MTINEKKQLSNYIKGLVRESLGEIEMPRWWKDQYPSTNNYDDEGEENDIASDEPFDNEEFDIPDTHNEFWEEDEGEPAYHFQNEGINKLRQLAESMAREAVEGILMEKKGGKGWKNHKKGDKSRKNKKQKTSSRGKQNLDFLKSDGVNKAAYAYKLFGARTKKEKASARSKFYKKLDGKKNDTGVPYKFNSKEIASVTSMHTNKEL